jgi:lipoyl(octanoyl) transferase
LGRAGESYRAVHESLAAWMKARGLPVSLTAGAVKQSDVCFANPAPHDIVAGEQKVSGAAQRRTRVGLLHQGSIQPVPATFRAEAETLAPAFANRVTRRPLTTDELHAAKTLEKDRYGTDEWLRRW